MHSDRLYEHIYDNFLYLIGIVMCLFDGPFARNKDMQGYKFSLSGSTCLQRMILNLLVF